MTLLPGNPILKRIGRAAALIAALIAASAWMAGNCLVQTAGAAEEIRRVPVAMGLASHPVNGGRCLVSDGEFQYIAFYDPEHRMTVGKRKLGETEWDFATLPERVGWDTHNKIVIFLDRDGYLHLTGNMHCHPLKYYRTGKPGDIHTFKGIHTWAGHYEDRVTYPSVFQTRDGATHMMYRFGSSGDGMRLLVHYSEDTQTWSGGGEGFINGRVHEPDCNAYPFSVVSEAEDGAFPRSGLVEDANGALHIAWCWRETPDVATNFDICYAKSLDGGHTWQTRNGEPLELPITPDNAEVVDDIPQRAGLMNGGVLALDKDGVPCIGYTRFDSDGHNQMFVATPADGEWKTVQLTDWKHRFWFDGGGTIPESPPVPRLTFAEDGRLEIHYSYRHVSPSNGRMAMTRKELLAGEPGSFEILPPRDAREGLPNVRAANHGPLPEGWQHFMLQKTARPNRDRKPDNPMEPTMIYVAEVKTAD